MTNEMLRQAAPGQQPHPQAAQPPPQSGAWSGQGGTTETVPPTPAQPHFVGPPPAWLSEAEKRRERGEGRPPELGFYPSYADKAAAEQRAVQLVESMSRQEEAKARQEEAKLERAKLTTGVPIPPPADRSAITLEFAMASDTATVTLNYLLDPYLPRGCVVCFAGRGGTAKSSFLASIAAHISGFASTLWVSVEELSDWIKVRHIKSGGAEGTLAVVAAVASKKDQQGRVIGSSFNIYEHLEPAIQKTMAALGTERPPLRLIVLDTAVGLTSWAKGESPNDDAAVKRLLGYLQGLAEANDLTIAFIQHSNKGKHDYFADTVAGASAWTNSPRLSFVHARDRREEHAYVMRVAKSNLTQAFATSYITEPVHTLYQRAEGADSVLCKVVPGALVWGEDESMQIFEDATRKPDEDEEGGGGGGGKALSPLDKVTQCLVEMVYMTTDPVTRDMVEARLGRGVNRRLWGQVDDRLRVCVAQYRLSVDHGVNNKVFYSRLVVPAAPPPP